MSAAHPAEATAVAAARVGEPEVIGSRYEVRSLLGTGGMSRVLRAWDRVRGEVVAVKILRAGVSDTRLASEFRYIAALHHPGIVRVLDFGLTNDRRPFFTMELVDGPDLLEFGRSVPLGVTLRAVRSALETLDFVHARGVVHCDIKPSNILISETPSGERYPKLLDFGVAWERGDDAETVGGTAYYMAPEVIEAGERTPQSDLYAMGVVMYYLLTGQVPYPYEDVLTVLQAHLTETPVDPRDLVPAVPDPIAEITLRLLEKDPEDRFANGRKVVAAIDAWLSRTTQRMEDAKVRVVSAPPRLIAFEPRFIGRDRELGELIGEASALADAGPDATGRVYVVHGDAGSGKTRLLEEIRVRGQLAGIECLHMDFTGVQTPAEAVDRIGAIIGGASGASGPRGVDVAEAPDEASWLRPEAPLSERLIGEAERLARACAELARPHGLVLLADALDQVPDAAVGAVRAFAARMKKAPVLLVGAGDVRRGAAVRTLLEDPDVRPMPIGRLRRLQADRVVASLLGDMADPRVICEHVHMEAGGNPAAIVRVVQALVGKGSLVERLGRWTVAEHLAGQLPSMSEESGLLQVAEALVQALAPEVRQVAEAAAFVGERFDRQLLAVLLAADGLELGEQELERRLRELVDMQLVERFPGGAEAMERRMYRFTQRAVRDLLVQRLDDERGRRWSGEAADELARRRAGGEAWDLRSYARHLRRAGRYEDALWAGAEAARELSRGGAIADAAETLGEVIAMLESRTTPDGVPAQTELWCELASWQGDLERRRGHVTAAIEWYRRVAELQVDGDTGDRRDRKRIQLGAARKLGDLLFERGELEEGETLLREALRVAKELDEAELLGRAAYTLGFHLIVAGRYEEGAQVVEEAVRVADVTGDALLSARALKLRSTLRWYRGELEAAEEDARASALAHVSLDVPRGAAEALGVVGNVLDELGRLDEARAAFTEALQYARRAGWLTGIGKLHNGLAIVHYRSDDWDGACDHWRAALGIANRTGNQVERALLLNNLGFVSACRGEYEVALELYAEALEVARKAALSKEESLILGNMGELYLQRGELDSAGRDLRRALALARELGAVDQEIEGERRLLELDLKVGFGHEAVLESADRLLVRARGAGLAAELAHVQRVRGEALAVSGDPVGAEEALREARERFIEVGSEYEAARVVRTAASLATNGLLGTNGVAADVREARKMFRRLRAMPELERARGIHMEGGVLSVAAPTEQNVQAGVTFDVLRGGTATTQTVVADAQLMARLLDVTRQMSAILEVDALLERIVDEAMDLLDSDRGFIVLVADDGRPKIRVTRSQQPVTTEQLATISETVVASVLHTRDPVIYDGLGEHPPSESAVLLGRSIVCLPLVSRGRLVGVLYLDATRPLAPRVGQRLKLLEVLTAQAAVLVDNARLMEEQRRKTELLSTVAHELETPLEAIRGYSQLMAGHTSAGQEVRGYARVVREQARRMNAVLANLIDISRLEGNDLEWSMVSIQVKDLLMTAMEVAEPLARMRRVRLTADIRPGLPTVYGNRDRLLQALGGYVTHAIHRTPAGGTVRLRAAVEAADRLRGPQPMGPDAPEPPDESGFRLARDEVVTIRVCDEGRPISAAERARIFQPYFGEDGEGPGLRLAIAKSVVERHGGRAWVDAEDTTPGTCMSLALFALAVD